MAARLKRASENGRVTSCSRQQRIAKNPPRTDADTSSHVYGGSDLMASRDNRGLVGDEAESPRRGILAKGFESSPGSSGLPRFHLHFPQRQAGVQLGRDESESCCLSQRRFEAL